jgi:hypothetical protein
MHREDAECAEERVSGSSPEPNRRSEIERDAGEGLTGTALVSAMKLAK